MIVVTGVFKRVGKDPAIVLSGGGGVHPFYLFINPSDVGRDQLTDLIGSRGHEDVHTRSRFRSSSRLDLYTAFVRRELSQLVVSPRGYPDVRLLLVQANVLDGDAEVVHTSEL